MSKSSDKVEHASPPLSRSRILILCLFLSFGFLFLLFSLVPSPVRAEAKPALPKQDENCLACHGTAGMKSDAGKSISVDPSKHAASVHGAILSCTDCHTSIKDFPHPKKVAKVQCSTCHSDESTHATASIHGLSGVACQSCHGDQHEITSAALVAPAKCEQCHADEVKALRASIHGQAAAKGDPDAPTCLSCHGSVHEIQTSSDATAKVAKKNLPDTCASCHSKPEFLARHKIPLAHPVELYKQSIHGRAVAGGNGSAAVCSDCHGSHDILPAMDTQSRVNHYNIPKTCGTCHTQISKMYLDSVHGQAMQAGESGAPVCSDCHGEHLILAPNEAGSLVNAARVSTVTCGRCHNDERLALRYNLPTDRVPSYADSYHGLAMRGGSQTVANCASCHGVHNIFASKDPRSTVNSANLGKTCGTCHSGAGSHFVIGPVHVQTSTGDNHPIVKWIRWTYWGLIPMTLGFMIVHNLLDFIKKMRTRSPHPSSGATVTRMNRYFRIAHWGIIFSFPTLVVTGFALKYPEAWWSRPFLLWESRFSLRGSIHRGAAIVLIAATIYHVIHLAVNKRDRLFLWAMIPTFRDATDILQVFTYNLGITKEAPKFAKFNYAEKIEYLAFMWGTFVMAASGFILWFNNFALRYFPKWVTDAATAVHYYEAILATFAILIWHSYMVIFDPLVYPMDTAWYNGKVPADHYLHARPEYYRALRRAGLIELPAEPPHYQEGEGHASADRSSAAHSDAGHGPEPHPSET